MTTPLPISTYASGTRRIPNCCAASTTIRYPSGNWVGLIRTAEARICAYMIALTHQASTGNSGSVTASWIRNGRTPTYCQREVTVSSPCVTWRTIVETISVHHPM